MWTQPFIPRDWLTVGTYIELLLGVLIVKTLWGKNVVTYSKNLENKGVCC